MYNTHNILLESSTNSVSSTFLYHVGLIYTNKKLIIPLLFVLVIIGRLAVLNVFSVLSDIIYTLIFYSLFLVIFIYNLVLSISNLVIQYMAITAYSEYIIVRFILDFNVQDVVFNNLYCSILADDFSGTGMQS